MESDFEPRLFSLLNSDSKVHQTSVLQKEPRIWKDLISIVQDTYTNSVNNVEGWLVFISKELQKL